MLLWPYLTSLAVLVGAALNAAFERVWPEPETSLARLELVRRLRQTAKLERLRGVADTQEMEALQEFVGTSTDDEPGRRRRRPRS